MKLDSGEIRRVKQSAFAAGVRAKCVVQVA